MLRGLASETFHCLSAGVATSAGITSFSRAWTRHLTAADFASSPGSDIDEEGLRFTRDGDWAE